MANANFRITVFTDPTCPYAYSAEPARLRLRWLYGDQITWDTKMIVLSGFEGEVPTHTHEGLSDSRRWMREKYQMPMSDKPIARVPESILACRAYLATKIFDTDKSELLLRNLRISAMNNELVDGLDTIDRAATKTGVDIDNLRKWIDLSETNSCLEENAKEARRPSKTALNMGHKLSKTSLGIVRYPASSCIFTVGNEVVAELPGFWPVEAYEAIIGNFFLGIKRKKNPKTIESILSWANMPLATKEISTIYDRGYQEVRDELGKSKMKFTPFGQDGFWALD